jgi:NitT/TauT family transport system substrate-binding protein
MVLQHACTCEAPQRLRIGMIRNAGCSFLPLAIEQGFFEQHNFQIDLQSFSNLAQAEKLLSEKPFDIFCSKLSELVLLPYDYQVLLIPDYSNGADVLIARKDAGRDLKELKGARIGVAPDSMGDLLVSRALAEQGLSREDFTILPKDTAMLREALQTSEIQLAVAAPPQSLEILQNKDMHVIFRSSAMPGEIIDTVAASANLLQISPQLIPKLQDIFQQTLHYIEQQPSQALERLAQNAALPVLTLQHDYRFLTLTEQAAYLQSDVRLLALIDQLQTRLLQLGSLKTRREPQRFLVAPDKS